VKFDKDDALLEAKTNKISWFPMKNMFNILTKNNKEHGGFFKLFKRYDITSNNSLLKKYRIDISYIASELIHEIVPNSFHYYLGAIQLEET